MFVKLDDGLGARKSTMRGVIRTISGHLTATQTPFAHTHTGTPGMVTRLTTFILPTPSGFAGGSYS